MGISLVSAKADGQKIVVTSMESSCGIIFVTIRTSHLEREACEGLDVLSIGGVFGNGHCYQGSLIEPLTIVSFFRVASRELRIDG